MPATSLTPTPRASRPCATAPLGARPGRLDGVDAVRGLAIVLMALDHVRAYLSVAHFDPTDLTQTTPALFLTRWLTHFCAPAFVLLAGAGAWLGGQRRTCGQLSQFLLWRGLWLVLLEFTVISLGWYFNLTWEMGAIAQVIWAIGVAMLVLAGLVTLPIRWVATIGLVLVAGHNLLDGVAPEQLGPLGAVWALLHVSGPLAGVPVLVVYPVLPWIGVMALGFALGPLLNAGTAEARRRLRQLGLGAVAAFLVLRALDGYGDPSPWAPQATPGLTVLSFLRVTKYPPSLAYLLMTLGPVLLLLSLRYPRGWRVAEWCRTLGRAPLFFYVAHIYLVHALALGVGLLQGHAAGDLARLYFFFPATYGVKLPAVYLAWGLVLLVLYPATRWFGERKRAGRAWWWSYL